MSCLGESFSCPRQLAYRAATACTLARPRRARAAPVHAQARVIVRAAALLALLICAQAPAQQVPPVAGALFAPLDVSESIPVSIVDMTGSARSGGVDDAQLARWALEDWSRALDGKLEFHVVESEDEALIRIRFVPPGGGQYGEMLQLRIDGRRGAAVFVRPDMQALGPVIGARAASDGLFRETVVYLTCVHELGHALGLAHTADYEDIMYAFGFGGDIEEYFLRFRRRIDAREDIRVQSGLSESDRARVRELYALEAQE